jgi:hypothetical protein
MMSSEEAVQRAANKPAAAAAAAKTRSRQKSAAGHARPGKQVIASASLAQATQHVQRANHPPSQQAECCMLQMTTPALTSAVVVGREAPSHLVRHQDISQLALAVRFPRIVASSGLQVLKVDVTKEVCC